MNVSRFAIVAAFITVSLAACQAKAQYIDNRASTPLQGIMYGEADVIRASGTYNKLTAEANNIDQDTYSKAVDNHLKSVEAYYKKKEIHNYAVQKQRKPPLSPEAQVRINQARAPKRLGLEQIDPAGNLYWPPVLQGPQFARVRGKIDELFVQRAGGLGGLGTDNHLQIQAVARIMKSQLQDYVTLLGSAEYMQASKFIDRLNIEARFPAQAEGLVAN